MQKIRCAFFDLDHTLTRADTGFAFLRFWAWRRAKGLRFLGCLARLGAAPFVLALWKLGLLRLQSVKNFFFSVLRSARAADVDAAARAFAQEAFDRLIKTEALAYLDALRPNYCLVLASASPEFYVKYFAERLGFEFYAATRYLICDGVCAGRIAGEDCRGPEKARRVSELISPERYDRAGSLAFSDNLKADAPLLALAGNAFHAHSTDWRLKRLGA